MARSTEEKLNGNFSRENWNLSVKIYGGKSFFPGPGFFLELGMEIVSETVSERTSKGFEETEVANPHFPS